MEPLKDFYQGSLAHIRLEGHRSGRDERSPAGRTRSPLPALSLRRPVCVAPLGFRGLGFDVSCVSIHICLLLGVVGFKVCYRTFPVRARV